MLTIFVPSAYVLNYQQYFTFFAPPKFSDRSKFTWTILVLYISIFFYLKLIFSFFTIIKGFHYDRNSFTLYE